ncbi:MAG: serine hydrolase [Candidatus Polarisedimenticolia bacterium]
MLRRQLVERLERLRSELPGAAGYCIRDLGSGETFEADAGAVYPAASTIKIPVLLSPLRLAQEGTIDRHRPIPIDPAARVEGGGVLETWSEPYPALSAAHLAALMMDFSDNFATNLLIDRVGMDRIGIDLRAWGLRDTRLRRRMMDLEAARAGRENVTTPRDLVTLLERLHGGGILDAAHTVRALSMMKRRGSVYSASGSSAPLLR